MRLRFFTMSLLLAGGLSSCYTNVNQLWFKGKREYEVCYMGYYSTPWEDAQTLPQVLYRCGDDWYLAAHYNRLSDGYPYSCIQWANFDFAERHGFEPDPQAPVYYHKITPELADAMLRPDQVSWHWFSRETMLRELARAGGEWIPQLPAGAKAYSSAFLRQCKSNLLLVEEHTVVPPSWYTYPAAGLTALVVDVPGTALALSLGCVASVAASIFSPSHAAATRSSQYHIDPLPDADGFGALYLPDDDYYDTDPGPHRGAHHGSKGDKKPGASHHRGGASSGSHHAGRHPGKSPSHSGGGLWSGGSHRHHSSGHHHRGSQNHGSSDSLHRSERRRSDRDESRTSDSDRLRR